MLLGKNSIELCFDTKAREQAPTTQCPRSDPQLLNRVGRNPQQGCTLLVTQTLREGKLKVCSLIPWQKLERKQSFIIESEIQLTR